MTGQAPIAITSTTCGIRGEALFGKLLVEITMTTKTTTMIATNYDDSNDDFSNKTTISTITTDNNNNIMTITLS